MKRILILGYSTYKSYIDNALSDLSEIEYDFHAFESIMAQGSGEYLSSISYSRYDGVASINEGTFLFAEAIARKLGLPAQSARSILQCQNKYISRLKQHECVSHNLPTFCLSSDPSKFEELTYPVFVKPVHGSLSFCAGRVSSQKELEEFIRCNKEKVRKRNGLYGYILRESNIEHELRDTYNEFIVESIVKGDQITVDGYVFGKKIVFFGITQAVMHSNGISFMRWDYPASFSYSFYQKIYDVVEKLICGFELNTTLFNVECMVDEEKGTVFIIEIHSRLSIQFVPLIEKVTGYNPIWALFDLARGIDPLFEHKKMVTAFRYCSSCVLRREYDGKAVCVPTKKEIAQFEKRNGVSLTPLVEKGKRLSEYNQDSKTFRYGLIAVAGKDVDEIQKRFETIQKELSYVFENDSI